MWWQVTGRRRIAVLFLLLSVIAVADCDNVIEQRLLQTAFGDDLAGGSALLQHASADGVISGEDNRLNQIVLQDSSGGSSEGLIREDQMGDSFGEGSIGQESYLAGIVIGSGNLLAQESNQAADDNDFSGPSYGISNGSLLQRSLMLLAVIGNESRLHQNISQSAKGNELFNATLIQTAKAAMISVGQDNNVTQEIERLFENRTLQEYSTVRQSSSLRSIVVASNVTVVEKDMTIAPAEPAELQG